MTRTFRLVFPLILFLFIVSVSAFGRGSSDVSTAPSLTVYCYDSFSSEWGAGPAIAEAFTEETGIGVEFIAPGDAVTVLNQAILEGDRGQADIILGLDQSLLARAIENEVLLPYRSPKLEAVSEDLILDGENYLTPYDFGHFAIIYDSVTVDLPPTSLEDLTSDHWADSLILMDPRTSSPGLGFLLWTVEVYGEDWIDYWIRLKPSILTITDGWSQGYTLFTAGEAPLVLSYGTSPVYHVAYEETDRYRAAEFVEGHLRQVEGLGIASTTDSREEAEAFIDFILGRFAQETLAMTNIMFPVSNKVELPAAFDSAMLPKVTLQGSNRILDDEGIADIISQWIEVFGQ